MAKMAMKTAIRSEGLSEAVDAANREYGEIQSRWLRKLESHYKPVAEAADGPKLARVNGHSNSSKSPKPASAEVKKVK